MVVSFHGQCRQGPVHLPPVETLAAQQRKQASRLVAMLGQWGEVVQEQVQDFGGAQRRGQDVMGLGPFQEGPHPPSTPSPHDGHAIAPAASRDSTRAGSTSTVTISASEHYGAAPAPAKTRAGCRAPISTSSP